MPYDLKWFNTNENLLSSLTVMCIFSRLVARISPLTLLTPRVEIEKSLIKIHESQLMFQNAFCTSSKEEFIENLVFLQNEEMCLYDELYDIICVETFGKADRFCLIYRFYSSDKNDKVNIMIHTGEGYPINTAQYVYPDCTWAEREIFEMYGVYFIDHDNLQKILMDYAFKGHPMRKDFPVTGYLEHFYSYHNNLIEAVPVEFMQEYRVFDFYNSWEKKEVCEISNEIFEHEEEDFLVGNKS